MSGRDDLDQYGRNLQEVYEQQRALPDSEQRIAALNERTVELSPVEFAEASAKGALSNREEIGWGIAMLAGVEKSMVASDNPGMDDTEALARAIHNIDTTGADWEDDGFGRPTVVEAATTVRDRLAELGWTLTLMTTVWVVLNPYPDHAEGPAWTVVGVFSSEAKAIEAGKRSGLPGWDTRRCEIDDLYDAITGQKSE